MADGASIRVCVVYALAEQAWVVPLTLPDGSTAAEAMLRAGLAAHVPGFDANAISLAIYSQAVSPETALRDGDRLELLRPLQADPKQARRKRALDVP